MKTNEILQVYTKYSEVIEKPTTNIINRFENFMKWLDENCESEIEGDIKLAAINITLKALKKKNISFNECVGWTKSYHDKFFNLLNKLKESTKRDDSTPYLVFCGRIFEFLEEIEKSNTTMYLYYWSHLYTQVLGDVLEKEEMKISQLAEETSKEVEVLTPIMTSN